MAIFGSFCGENFRLGRCPGNRGYRLVLEDGGDALLGLLDLALEGGLEVPQLGKLLTVVGLLDVVLSDTALLQAGELNRLGGHLAVSDL